MSERKLYTRHDIDYRGNSPRYGYTELVPDTIAIAAGLSVNVFPDESSPLILEVVQATITALQEDTDVD